MICKRYVIWKGYYLHPHQSCDVGHRLYAPSWVGCQIYKEEFLYSQGSMVTTILGSGSGFTFSGAMVSLIAEGMAMEIDAPGSKFA